MSVHGNRIAFISSQAFSVYNFRGALISALIEKGAKVFALAPDYDDDSRNAVIALGAEPVDIRLSRAGMNPLRDGMDVWRLSRQLRELRLDACFTYFIKPVIYGTIAAAIVGIPKRFAMIEGAGYVFNEQDDLQWKRRILRRVVIVLYRLALRFAQRVFMLNRDDRQLFLETGMVTADKVVLLNGIGINLTRFSPRPLADRPACFIMVARLLREKGVYDYFEAARIVKKIHPEVRFILLGSIDCNPGSLSQSEVDACVMDGVVECPGHVADVRDWIEHAHVFVLPSYREGVPRSTMEAMAMAKPIITTNAVGCKETVEEGVNGFKIPVCDVDALATAMSKFISEPELIARMGAASRRMAENKFDVEKINKRILSVIMR